MSQIMHTLRFVVGMSMLAGGAVLAEPFVSAVLEARQAAGPAGAVPPADQRSMAPAPAIGVAGHAIPDPRQPPPQAGVTEGAAVLDAGGPPWHGHGRQERLPPLTPPVPPAPLPASGLEFAPAVPPLDGTYRSTVEIPPPPLLDGQAPPPLSVGWTTRDVSAPPVPATALQPAVVPAEYVVRDGDDLTGIALKVYGHAGAAAAIWAANRDRLTDPQLLPIGLPLRLPPSWTLPAQAARGGAGGLAIEPGLSGAGRSVGRTTAAVPPAARGAAEQVWLDGAATGR
jgi:nucleoid-associated protein YgaU